MAKQRRTRKQKLVSHERQEKREGFVINDEWLKTTKRPEAKVIFDLGEKKFFRSDLTKTGILTMLVLALELAIWSYLSRH